MVKLEVYLNGCSEPLDLEVDYMFTEGGLLCFQYATKLRTWFPLQNIYRIKEVDTDGESKP